MRPRGTSILATVIAPAALLLLSLSPSTSADAIFAPGDAILGGRRDAGINQFLVGGVGTVAATNNWPAGESPDHAIDGVGQKYLNFAQTFTGFLVRPNFNGGNGAIATSMQLWAANDAVDRDPASYEIWGSNSVLDFGAFTFDMTAFTQVSSGSLALPATRNAGGLAALLPANSQTVTFSNLTGYKNYLVVFPSVKNPVANSMQIAEVQLFGIAAFTSLTWTGNASNIWNINDSINWNASGSPSTYSDTNGVTFNDAVTAAQTNITVQAGGAGVRPAAVLFQNDALNYTMGGEAINSPGTLTLNGTATVTLNNANSYATGTTVNAGSLIIGATGSLAPNPLVVNNTNTGAGRVASVTFNAAQTIGSLSGTVTLPATGTNFATINLGGDLTVDQSSSGTFGGDITGAGGLIKLGAAMLTLTGFNTYTGPTIITAGTLNSSAPAGGAQGSLPAGKPVMVGAGATLLFGANEGAGFHQGSVASITANGGTIRGGAGTHSTLPTLTLEGANVTAVDGGNFVNGIRANYTLDGDVTTLPSANPTTFGATSIILRKDPTNSGTSSPVTFDVARGTGAVDLNIQSTIKDQGAGFVKTGNGILSLTTASAYLGPTVISEGKLIVANSDALGSGIVTLENDAVLSLQAPPSLAGFGGFSLNNGATVDPTNTQLTLTTDAGNQSRSAFFTTPIPFASGFAASFVYTAGGSRVADGFTFTIQNSAPTAVGGGGGQLGYVGIPNSAALQFNIYTGGGQPVGTAVGAGTAGPYVPSAPVNLASGNPILINVVYDAVAGTVSETLTDQVTNDTYNNVFSGIDLPAVIGANVGYVGFTGATGGAFALQTVGNFAFGSSSPSVSLSNLIQIPAGVKAGIELQPNPAGGPALGNLDGIVTLGLGATLDVTGGATATHSPYELTLGDSVLLSGDATISVVNNGTAIGTVLASGVIEETAVSNLTKVGNGTLAIASASTYSGTTTVNGGVLLVTGSLSGATTTVNSTATLAGDGTVTGVIVAGGGTLAPGNAGIGTLDTGPLSLLSGSTFALEIGSSTADQVKINGAGTLTGTIPLALSLTADPTDFLTFTILDGSAPLLGYSLGARFSYLGAPLAEGQSFLVASGTFSQEFVISYAADGNQDVTLTAVPEPATTACLLLGLGIPLALRRRR